MITATHIHRVSNIYQSYSTIIVGALIFIVLIILLIFTYIKITFRFWSQQPVFHLYDLSYYVFSPGIIKYELPEKNKYCNFENIVFEPFSTKDGLKVAFEYIIRPFQPWVWPHERAQHSKFRAVF